MNRRTFLRLLGLGATAGAGLVLAEPVRRIWQVSRAAPVCDARFWDEFMGVAQSPCDSLSGVIAIDGVDRTAEEAWTIPHMPQLREWLGPKAAADWDRDAYCRPVTDSDIAWHLNERLPGDMDWFARGVERAVREGRVAYVDGQGVSRCLAEAPDWLRRVEEHARGLGFNLGEKS